MSGLTGCAAEGGPGGQLSGVSKWVDMGELTETGHLGEVVCLEGRG